MFLPIGDEPNLRGTPWVNYILIGLNVAIWVLISWPLTARGVSPSDPAVLEYVRIIAEQTGLAPRAILAQTSAYDLFIFAQGFKPADPSLWSFFVSMFLHGSWLHLGGNMLFLWIFGDNIEMHVGRLPYLGLYLLTGAAATGLYSLFVLDSMVPMVGASGAISGVLGLYFLWFPRNRVRILVFLFFFLNVIRLPARWVLGFYLVVENLFPFLFGASTGVAHGAHIGGFLGGLGAAAVVNRLRLQGSMRRMDARARSSPAQEWHDREPVAAGFHRALAAGEWERALRAYADMTGEERRALRDDDVLDLSDWLARAGQLEAALAVLQRFIATHPASDALPRAHLRAGLIHLREGRLPAAYQHFLTVLDLDPAPAEEDGARAGLAEVERRQREQRVLRFH